MQKHAQKGSIVTSVHLQMSLLLLFLALAAAEPYGPREPWLMATGEHYRSAIEGSTTGQQYRGALQVSNIGEHYRSALEGSPTGQHWREALQVSTRVEQYRSALEGSTTGHK